MHRNGGCCTVRAGTVNKGARTNWGWGGLGGGRAAAVGVANSDHGVSRFLRRQKDVTCAGDASDVRHIAANGGRGGGGGAAPIVDTFASLTPPSPPPPPPPPSLLQVQLTPGGSVMVANSRGAAVPSPTCRHHRRQRLCCCYCCCCCRWRAAAPAKASAMRRQPRAIGRRVHARLVTAASF
jgi:hypothetical protein